MALLMAAVLMLASPGLPAGLEAGGGAEGGAEIGGVFGRAIASARGVTSSTIELDLAVEADPGVTVFAHLIDPGGVQETLPLASRGGGTFGIRAEVRRLDYVVVFEMIDGRLAAESQPFRLSDLGIEPSVLGVRTVPTTTTTNFSETTRQWGWAGLGLAAAALTLVALWAVPARRRRAA